MTYEKVFDALGDHTRRLVLELLAAGPSSVEELAARLPVSRPAVSQHLKRLLDAGLAKREVQGRRNVYSVERSGIALLREYADRMWNLALHRFREFAASNDFETKKNDAAVSGEKDNE